MPATFTRYGAQCGLSVEAAKGIGLIVRRTDAVTPSGLITPVSSSFLMPPPWMPTSTEPFGTGMVPAVSGGGAAKTMNEVASSAAIKIASLYFMKFSSRESGGDDGPGSLGLSIRSGWMDHQHGHLWRRMRFLLKMQTSEQSQSKRDPFEELRIALNAEALFAARGVEGNKGAVQIGEHLATIGVTKEFVAGYAPLAPYDIVGILFAADARIVERVSASQYDLLKGPGNSSDSQAMNKKIQGYLRQSAFEHLILAGLRSKQFGLAWVVAYRGPGGHPFNDTDAETARYRVPYVLFDALCKLEPNGLRTSAKAQSASIGKPKGGLVPLDPERLRVAILEARGYGAKSICELVHKSEGAVRNYLTHLRELLNVPSDRQRITMVDLEHYSGEVSDRYAQKLRVPASEGSGRVKELNVPRNRSDQSFRSS